MTPTLCNKITFTQWMAANQIKLNAAKTELMWSGTKNNLLKIPGGSGGLQLTLAGDHIAASLHPASSVYLGCC